MQNAPSPRRFAHIDAIRAVAVLLVMWTHYTELLGRIAGSQHWLDAIQRFFDFGRIGVVLFFCISGMLIPTSLRGAVPDGTRRFLIRRFFRLYPAFWLSLPLGYAVYWLLSGRHMPLSGLVANATMIPTAFGFEPMMGHYWTLETELYFYVLTLLLFRARMLHSMRALCLTCAGLCVLFVATSALKVFPTHTLSQYKGMLYHLAIMVWGACFRQAYDYPEHLVTFGTRRIRVTSTYRRTTVALALLLVVIALLMAIVDWRHHDYAHVSTSFAYVLAIIAFVALATVMKIRARPLARLGEISYSVYLLHGIPLHLTFWFCQHYPLSGGPLSAYVVAPALLTIPLSWVSYRLGEAPFVRLVHAWTSGSAAAVKQATEVAP